MVLQWPDFRTKDTIFSPFFISLPGYRVIALALHSRRIEPKVSTVRLLSLTLHFELIIINIAVFYSCTPHDVPLCSCAILGN